MLQALLDIPPFEWGLIVLVSLFFHSLLKPGWQRPILSILPVIAYYQLYPRFKDAFGRPFRLADFSETPELVQVLPATTLIPVGVAILAVVVLYLLNIHRKIRLSMVIATALLGTLVGAVEIAPRQYLETTRPLMVSITPWSDWLTAEKSGYLATTFYSEARRNNALQALRDEGDAKHIVTRQNAAIGQLKSRRQLPNVHLVILESYLDPLLFRDLAFNPSPRPTELEQLVGDNGSLFVSPVFGGNTAQAEFEALCGAPALARFASIEFNLFSGANAHCLPDTLRQAGYLTIASNAFRPDFFNEVAAYRGVGFEQIFFPKQYFSGQTYLSNDSGDYFMFDGDLFQQNLAYLKRVMGQGQPLFNYVLGVYGHHPHTLGEGKKPVIEIESENGHPAGELLRKATDQAYYRNRALGVYLRQLIEIDPDAIIVVLGDHLPVLDDGVNTYRQFHYLGDGAYHKVRGYVFEHGVAKPFSSLHEYQIRDLIIAYLTGKPFSVEDSGASDRQRRERDYLSIMKNATR